MDQPREWVDAAEEKRLATNARRKSLFQRIVTGLGFGVFVVVLTFLPQWGGLPFVLAVSLLSVVAASEFYSAVRKQGAEPSDFLGFVACVLFQLAAWRRAGNTLDPYLQPFLVALVLVTMLVELVKPKQKPILNIGATLLGAIYCGWLLSFLVAMHGSGLLVKPPIAGTTPGEWLAVFMLAVTSSNDIGGLFVGNAFGRTKLAPAISPKKTWEGAAGGVAFSMLIAYLIGRWIHFPLESAVVLGALLAVAGLIGDLCESALKRDLGVKDFGVILPGHGGILDRIDSTLFTAPVMYYFLLILTSGRH